MGLALIVVVSYARGRRPLEFDTAVKDLRASRSEENLKYARQ